MLIRLELLAFVALGVVLILVRRPLRWRSCALFNRLAANRGLSILLVGGFAFLTSASLSLWGSWPEPQIHDEFSYLLAGDTFAHGRLTNPPHPLWQHFETHHVNFQPTYASMYPPGQGLMLALGQVLGGHPLVGVWLSFALACAALCWMLQAWVPRRWALAGSLLAVVRVGFLGSWHDLIGYWSQSYWGGAVAMLGGALVFGALRRLFDRPRVAYAVTLGVGLIILANSRPFEGFLTSLPVAAALLYWIWRRRPSWSMALGHVVLPLIMMVALGAGGMAAYNARLTGDWRLLPYQLNGRLYAIVPLFLWQPLSPEPTYHHEVMRAYHTDWAVQAYLRMRTPQGHLRELINRVQLFGGFYLGLILALPLLTLPWILRQPWTRFAAACIGVLLVGFLVTTWFQPHYAAPIACLVFVLVVQGIRQLRLWRWEGRRVGHVLTSAMPVAHGALLLSCFALAGRDDPDHWHLRRAQLLEQLRQKPGLHLVIVHYREGHSPHEEWVFNEADIDGAKVAWARDLGPEGNRDLLHYFHDRQVWLLEADQKPAALTPYPHAAEYEPPRTASGPVTHP